MTEAELRQSVVDVGRSYIGTAYQSAKHLELLAIYNTYPKPYARKYTVKPTDEYCATATSAFFIKAGLAQIFPLECGCGEAINIASGIMHCWEENDAFVPQTGDVILIDRNDNGIGDNHGWATHIMLVEKCEGNIITCVNANDSKHGISSYSLAVNAKGIRGFIRPDFASLATPEEKPLYIAEAGSYCYVWKDTNKLTRLPQCPALGAGNRVEVLSEEGDFYKVRIAGKSIGYVEKTLRKRT